MQIKIEVEYRNNFQNNIENMLLQKA